MSGADALAAFGLACNIFQAIQFAGATISVLKNMYKTGYPDPSLAENNRALKGIVEDLEFSLGKLPKGSKSDLVPLTKKCLEISTALEKEAGKIAARGSSQHGIIKKITKFAATTMKKGKMEHLSKELREAQRTLETGLLARTW